VISVGAGIPSFIVTLGMLEIARGFTKVITDSQTKYIGSSVESIGEPLPGILLSPAFLLAIAVVLAGQFLLSRTVFGRYCVAIGTNEEAVRMSGIHSKPYSITVFVISGVLCALAGLTQTSRLSTADPNAAIGIELAAIAACVIGGTSLMGGRGNVINSFLGVLIIAVLQTGLAQLGVSDANKQIITGSVIIVAVLLDAIRIRWGKPA
jgi:ribose transport system permease protein